MIIDLSRLTIDASIGYLPLDNFQVEITCLGYEVAERFEQEPHLPGVIVTNGAELVGVLSHQKFLEAIGRPFGRDLYLSKSIQVLLSTVPAPPLQLADTCKIDAAASKALNRPHNVVYDPAVVTFRDGSFRLLDIHILLLAQSHMLALVNRMAQKQQAELQRYLAQLQQEQAKAEEANRILELQQISIRDRNQLLEEQKAELLQQSEEIAQLNQKFVQISQILSMEGKKAFQATFEGVDAISRNTDNMIEIGKALAEHLERVRGASGLIKEVSKRAQFLSLQAAVLANQLGSEFEGVGRVTSDIGKLSSQTFEAGQRMDETASFLKIRIGDLTKLAREGATVAQALIGKVARAEMALAELENLVQQQDADSAMAQQNKSPSIARELLQRIERAGLALSELEKISAHGDVARLISKIEQRLNQSNKPVLH